MTAKLKNVKNGINVGYNIPKSQQYGNIGRHLEQVLADNGHHMSNSRGVDMPDINAELKSRKQGSKSYHSVGAISIDEMIHLPFKQTHLYEKMQTQYRVKYDDDLQVVTSESVYDFSNSEIQEILEDAYEAGRIEIQDGNRSSYIPCGSGIILEKASNSTYQYRISNGTMKKFENIAKSNIGNLFDFD